MDAGSEREGGDSLQRQLLLQVQAVGRAVEGLQAPTRPVRLGGFLSGLLLGVSLLLLIWWVARRRRRRQAAPRHRPAGVCSVCLPASAEPGMRGDRPRCRAGGASSGASPGFRSAAASTPRCGS